MQKKSFHKVAATATLLLLPLLAAAQQHGSTFADHFDGITTAQSDVITLRTTRHDSNGTKPDTMLFRFVPIDTLPVDTGKEGRQIGRVTGIYVGATEVTRRQWEAIMGTKGMAEPRHAKRRRKDTDVAGQVGELPATGMKMTDVLDFIDSVARIGSQHITLLDMNSTAAKELCNYKDSIDNQGHCYKVSSPFDRHNLRHTAWLRCPSLHRVATKVPDHFGIYDLAGNARELYMIKNVEDNGEDDRHPAVGGTYTLILWGGSYRSDEDKTQYLQWDPKKDPDFRLPDDAGIRLAYQQSFFISLE